jgi:hypothetical protein
MKHWMVAVALMVGCGGGGGSAEPAEPTEPAPVAQPSDVPTNHETVESKRGPVETAEAAPISEPAEQPVARSSEDYKLETGVPVCDDAYNKYFKCVEEKASDLEGFDAILDGLAQSADAWKQAATTDEGRKALAEACAAAEPAWKQSAEALGCTW